MPQRQENFHACSSIDLEGKNGAMYRRGRAG